MPPRKVDARKTRKALKKLQRAVETAKEKGGDAKLSGWEEEFASSVEKKLTIYGSAFRDASKGRLEEALSVRQAQKLGEIARKARGKGGGLKRTAALKTRKPLKSRKPMSGRPARVRDIAEDVDAPPPGPKPKRPKR